MSTPRGLRNCNPLNIRHSSSRWQGMRSQQQDAAFVQFEAMEWGWRAAFRLLTRTYYQSYRLDTIRTIVARWAPSNENNTQAYINRVAQLTGFGPDESIGSPARQPARWMALATAMAIHENGTTAIDPMPMLRGWLLL